MKYLLLIYDRPDYWETGSPQRDAEEESQFGAFCTWLREQGITWTSAALAAPTAPGSPGYVSLQKHHPGSEDASTAPALGTIEVVSGLFILDVPDGVQPDAIVDRFPRVSTRGIEVRLIDSGDV